MKSHTLTLAALAAALALAVPASADAATSSSLSLRAKITRFHATAGGVVADGTLTGRLRSGTSVSRDRASVRFRVAAKRRGRRCDVITLRLAPLDLELLGVQVNTSHIKLDIYARKGRVLGDLFCALAHAKVTFPRVARAMNARLDGRSLRVLSTSQSLPASVAQAQPASWGRCTWICLDWSSISTARLAAGPWSSRSTRSPTRACSASCSAGSPVAAASRI
jgi:hypothetical protein